MEETRRNCLSRHFPTVSRYLLSGHVVVDIGLFQMLFVSSRCMVANLPILMDVCTVLLRRMAKMPVCQSRNRGGLHI